MNVSSIALKTFAIRNFSTESKKFVESNDNLFSKVKVEANTLICGFTGKRIQHILKAYVEMLRYVRWGNLFLVCKTCHRVHSCCSFSTVKIVLTVETNFSQNEEFAFKTEKSIFLPSNVEIWIIVWIILSNAFSEATVLV